jgi:hypothetical protein
MNNHNIEIILGGCIDSINEILGKGFINGFGLDSHNNSHNNYHNDSHNNSHNESDESESDDNMDDQKNNNNNDILKFTSYYEPNSSNKSDIASARGREKQEEEQKIGSELRNKAIKNLEDILANIK